MEEQRLETMRGSEFAYDSIDLLIIDLLIVLMIALVHGRSYKDSPEGLKNKKATINDNCFQYAIKVVLNHQNINNHPERVTRVTNINPFINKYN